LSVKAYLGSQTSMSPMESQSEKAEAFRKMHKGEVLLLPNAWDVPSARIFEDSGFKAIATSSAGMMVSLGYPDGQRIPADEFLSVVRKVATVLHVPLSVDTVSGFGEEPDSVAKFIGKVIQAGAVGINIEDFDHESRTMRPLEKQLGRLKALVKLRDESDVRFVINARTDSFRFAPGDESDRFDEAVRRGRVYRDAGADCIYPMGLVGARHIESYVKSLESAVNVMVRKGLPPVGELKRLGVARLSFGPSASYAAFGLLKRASREVLESGTYTTLTEGAINFEELNSLAEERKGPP
jgi:2-methylisocitrate lyase-like PEP mutase family enzyme